MTSWKDRQFEDLENAVAELYRILQASKREALTDKQVQHNIVEFMREKHDVTVSAGWIAGIYYGGAPSIERGSWLAVQSFIEVMRDPRLSAHALQKKRPFTYIEQKKEKNR